MVRCVAAEIKLKPAGPGTCGTRTCRTRVVGVEELPSVQNRRSSTGTRRAVLMLRRLVRRRLRVGAAGRRRSVVSPSFSLHSLCVLPERTDHPITFLQAVRASSAAVQLEDHACGSPSLFLQLIGNLLLQLKVSLSSRLSVAGRGR